MARTRQRRLRVVTPQEPLTIESTSTDVDALEPAPPDSIGALLRSERERRRLDLVDVADQVKIRRVHLQALEANRFDLLPAGTYAVSFLRSYAEYLGLDSDELVRRHRQAADGTARKLELNFPQPIAASRLPSGGLILTLLPLVLVIYLAWEAFLGPERVALPQVEPVPAHLQAIAPPPLPEQAATTSESTPARTRSDEAPKPSGDERVDAPSAPAPSGPPPASERNIVAAPPPPIQAIPESRESASEARAVPVVSPPPVLVVAPPPPAPIAVAPAPPPPAPPVVAPLPPPPAAPSATASASSNPDATTASRVFGEPGESVRVTIHAQANSWVQVRDLAGAIVFTRLMQAGETFHVPNRQGLLLTTGNAAALELKVDGKALAPLGGPGVVRRDVALDPDKLLAGG
jgi:cytoskeleton protein RodZ